MIGCAVESHAHVNGLMFSKRDRGDRMQLWLGTKEPAFIDSIA